MLLKALNEQHLLWIYKQEANLCSWNTSESAIFYFRYNKANNNEHSYVYLEYCLQRNNNSADLIKDLFLVVLSVRYFPDCPGDLTKKNSFVDNILFDYIVDLILKQPWLPQLASDFLLRYPYFPPDLHSKVWSLLLYNFLQSVLVNEKYSMCFYIVYMHCTHTKIFLFASQPRLSTQCHMGDFLQ